MNEAGTPTNLVPTHPGNLNAAKMGVYSARMLAPRVAEVEAQLCDLSAREARRELLRHEVAGLAGLVEALDAALASGGVTGRRGQPHSLVDKRLRANDKLRRTLLEYQECADLSETADHATLAQTLETLGALYLRVAARTNETTLENLDPHAYLLAFVVTPDKRVTMTTRARAYRKLQERTRGRPFECDCFARQPFQTVVASTRVLEFRLGGLKPAPGDRNWASVVRALAQDEAEGLSEKYPQAVAALTHIVENYVKLHTIDVPAPTISEMLSWELGIGRDALMQVLMAPEAHSASALLEAFDELERSGVIPVCTCPTREEFRATAKKILVEPAGDFALSDLLYAMSRDDWPGSFVRCRYPMTYAALVTRIDCALAYPAGESVGDRG